MPLDTSSVLTGSPKKTGGILDAPVGTTAPTSATAVIPATFGVGGYVSADGVTVNKDGEPTSIRAWGNTVVKQVPGETTFTVSWSEMQTDITAMKRMFGEDAVTEGEGGGFAVAVSGAIPTPRAWIFEMYDNGETVRIVVPNGQASGNGEVTFNDSNVVNWPMAVTAMADESGNLAYIYRS